MARGVRGYPAKVAARPGFGMPGAQYGGYQPSGAEAARWVGMQYNPNAMGGQRPFQGPITDQGAYSPGMRSHVESNFRQSGYGDQNGSLASQAMQTLPYRVGSPGPGMQTLPYRPGGETAQMIPLSGANYQAQGLMPPAGGQYRGRPYDPKWNVFPESQNVEDQRGMTLPYSGDGPGMPLNMSPGYMNTPSRGSMMSGGAPYQGPRPQFAAGALPNPFAPQGRPGYASPFGYRGPGVETGMGDGANQQASSQFGFGFGDKAQPAAAGYGNAIGGTLTRGLPYMSPATYAGMQAAQRETPEWREGIGAAAQAAANPAMPGGPVGEYLQNPRGRFTAIPLDLPPGGGPPLPLPPGGGPPRATPPAMTGASRTGSLVSPPAGFAAGVGQSIGSSPTIRRVQELQGTRPAMGEQPLSPGYQAQQELNTRNEYGAREAYEQGMRPAYGGRSANDVMGEANQMYSPAIGYPDRNNVQPVDGRFAVNPQGRYARGGQYMLPGAMMPQQRGWQQGMDPSVAAVSQHEQSLARGADPAERDRRMEILNNVSGGRFGGYEGARAQVATQFPAGGTQINSTRPMPSREQLDQNRAAYQERAAGRKAASQAAAERRWERNNGGRGGGAFGRMSTEGMAMEIPPNSLGMPAEGTDGEVPGMRDANHPLAQAVSTLMDMPKYQNNPEGLRAALIQANFNGDMIDAYLSELNSANNGGIWSALDPTGTGGFAAMMNGYFDPAGFARRKKHIGGLTPRKK